MQHKKLLKLFLLPVFIIFSQHAQAVQWIAEAGMHSGGDEVNILNSNGNADSFKAGEFMTMAIGPQLAVSNNSNIRILLGWKFTSMNAMHSSSDNVKFSRYPIDVMYFHQTKRWNFGAGFTYHFNPELSGAITNLEYQDALGYLVEVDFRLGEFFYLGGKYTVVDYEQKNNNNTIDGNSIGVVMGFVFGK